MTELTEKVLNSTLKTEEVIKEVNRYLLDFRGWGKDKRDDFITDYFTEIKGIAGNFVFMGSPFEAYLHATIRFYIMNRRRKKSKEYNRESVFEAIEKSDRKLYYSEMADQSLCEETPSYGSCMLKTTETGVIEKETDRKRLLYLILYNCYNLHDSHIEKACELLGMETDKLLNMVQDMKNISRQAHERYTDLKDVKNKAFFKLRKLELMWEKTEDSVSKKILGNLGGMQKKRLERAERRLDNCRHSPSHTEIAGYLKIPKGTVDSGFFYLNKTMENRQPQV